MEKKDTGNHFKKNIIDNVDWQEAHLLIWAVFVMHYRAGANKDICAAERKRKNRS